MNDAQAIDLIAAYNNCNEDEVELIKTIALSQVKYRKEQEARKNKAIENAPIRRRIKIMLDEMSSKEENDDQ